MQSLDSLVEPVTHVVVDMFGALSVYLQALFCLGAECVGGFVRLISISEENEEMFAVRPSDLL